MKISEFLHYFFHSPIARRAVVTLIALTWNSLAVCGQIHYAAQVGDLARVEALLKDNPNLVSSQDAEGNTPLHIAAADGHKDVAEFLLANKAEVNARSVKGETPLHEALLKGHKDVMELLLANKAEVNARDIFGYTPLHLAARKGPKDAVEILLANKAEINAKTIMGITPLDAAVWGGHKDVEELLRQHGGANGVIGLYEPGDGVLNPTSVTCPTPPSTAAARRARVEGIVILQAIIRKDGTVTDVKVIKKLGYGLDELAVNTISNKWRFTPGTFKGEPVDVIATIEIRFWPPL